MKAELENLKKLKKEAEQLERELQWLPVTFDAVKGSMPEHPYIEQRIRIEGIDEDKSEQIKRKLNSVLQAIQEEILVMENYLDSVSDPETRIILRLYYRNGLTQREIGKELGYDRSVISRKLKIFWENQTCTQNTQSPV